MKKAFPWLIVLLVLLLSAGAYLVCARWELNTVLVIFLTAVFAIAASICLAFACQPYMLHNNPVFSHMIWEVGQIQQERRTLTDEQAAKLEEKFKAFSRKKSGDLSVLALRYAGDLHLARGNSRSAESYYQKVLETAKPGSEQYHYSRHRIALCHLRQRNDEKAFQEFETLAQESDFYTVGYANMLQFGWGTEPSPKEALALFEKSLKAGNSLVNANIWEINWYLKHGAPGNAYSDFEQYMRCCHDGRGARSGVHALRQAASAGYVPAQFELGTAYLDRLIGDNRQQQIKEGIAWLRKAADADYPPALHNLGLYTQRLCLDPVTGEPAKPVIPGTFLYKNSVRFGCYDAGMILIRKAAAAGFAPAIETVKIESTRNAYHPGRFDD